jgi:hypothetical protein
MRDALIAGFETDTFCGFLRSKFPSFSESRRPLKVGQTFLSAILYTRRQECLRHLRGAAGLGLMTTLNAIEETLRTCQDTPSS